MSQNVLLIGATSGMAREAARCFAGEHACLLLIGRDESALQADAEDLRLRGAGDVQVHAGFDALKPESWTAALAEADRRMPEPDIVLIAYGSLPDQPACEADSARTVEALHINFTSVAALCGELAKRMEARGRGTLGVISSVAGLRGRQSNYVYGAAKGGLNVFLQGLRNRLAPKGVRVVTFLPGFVSTPMTAHLPQGPLFASAETAGSILHKGLTRSKADVIYVPFFWRYILWIIRAIPERVFKRLKL